MLGSPDVPAARAGMRLLIIDDDAEFAESLGSVLEEAGHQVRIASSASEALGFLATFLPNVAIADIRMPIVDGYALLAILRADAKLDACTFIGISGEAHEVTRAAEAFDHFFLKPVNMSLLLDALERRTLSARVH